jgi:hypothetical protein
MEIVTMTAQPILDLLGHRITRPPQEPSDEGRSSVRSEMAGVGSGR